MRPLSLRCDNCGAALRPAAHLPTVECEHCHQVVLLAPRPAPAAVVRTRSRVGLVGGAVLAACGIAAVALAARPTAAGTTTTSSSTTTIAVSSTRSSSVTVKVEAAPPPPPPWREVARFGQAGTGGGMFTEPRHIAVSPEGTVYVAEARTGRVHRFDGGGRFEALYTVEPDGLTRDRAIFGMAAGAGGRLWLNRGGDLVALDRDGKVERTVRGDYPETWYHGAVALDATGAVYAATDRTGRHDLVKLSPAGKVLARHANTGARELAVDGLGAVVLARQHGGGVDLLAPDGALRARFGQVASPGALAVDARGRILVEDGGALAIFEPDGRKLARLEVPRFVDLAVDAAGHVYLLGRERVTKIELRH
jgi:streptogramin lyase